MWVPLLMVGGGLKVLKTQGICHRKWYRCSLEKIMAMKPTEAPAGYAGDPALRPTSPPPPRKTGPIDPLQSACAMIRDLREALKTADEWKARLRKTNDDLQRQIRELRCELGKHECPSCGERDIAKHRYFDEREEPMCSACGKEWD